MYKHILLPTDGSKLSEKAVKHAVQLARASNAKLTALNVTSDYPELVEDRVSVPNAVKEQYYADSRERSKKILESVKTQASAVGITCEGTSVHGTEPSQVIIAYAKEHHCDLIVMASHGRRGIVGVLLGSETTKVLTHSTVPVLVVR